VLKNGKKVLKNAKRVPKNGKKEGTMSLKRAFIMGWTTMSQKPH
jgi:hypothetical protein